MITYENTIILSWVIYILVWIVSAFNVKRDMHRGSGHQSRFWLVLLWLSFVILFISIRVATGKALKINPGVIFSQGIFPQFQLIGWIAAVVTIIGVVIAIWARVNLGRNWSSKPAVKENHELVTTGPYAYVRHPVYTGVILMAFGIAITGSIFGIGAFIIASFFYILRIGKEEKIMQEIFPNEYPEYRKRTKRLIPFVW